MEAKQRQNRVQDRYGTERGKKKKKKNAPVKMTCATILKKESNQLCDRANLLINAHCYFSGIVCSNSQQRALYFKLIKQNNVIGNMLKCLCRCSTLFFSLSPCDRALTFLWHTQRKREPIIISAPNDGFGNYFRGVLQNSRKTWSRVLT